MQRILKNKNGMTLIEVVVAFAIIAVVSVVIIIGFRTMGSVLNEGGEVSRLDRKLEKDIAISSPSAVTSGAVLKISGDAIAIDGNIKEYTIKDKDGESQTFRIFESE